MYTETGSPFTGEKRSRLTRFLNANGLDYDEGISFSVCLMDDEGEIAAAGSLDGATLKCIAVSPEYQGMDMTAKLLTELCAEAFRRGIRHLMLFTKPQNEMIFRSLGFFRVMRTRDCLLMENRANGLDAFISSLTGQTCAGTAGAVVANCDPMTNGHKYLIETARAQCDVLHVFVLSEAKGRFSPVQRLEIVQKTCAGMDNVFVHPSGPYMISSSTFPDYFIRDKSRVQNIRCELDVRIFAERIAPQMHITRRFVGTEPFSPTTKAYNEYLKAHLPGYGIAVTEIPRMEIGAQAVSASRVRALYAEGRMDEIRALVPDATYEFLKGADL